MEAESIITEIKNSIKVQLMIKKQKNIKDVHCHQTLSKSTEKKKGLETVAKIVGGKGKGKSITNLTFDEHVY